MSNPDSKPNVDNLNGLFETPVDVLEDRIVAEEVYFYLCNLIADLEEGTDEVAFVTNWPTEYQNIFYTSYLLAEVSNGGFNQYYYNFSGNYAAYTPGSFKAIGAIQHSSLVNEANGVFKAEEEKIIESQDGSLEGFSESYEDNSLEEFDDKIYELEAVEDVIKLQADYIRANRVIFADM